MTAEQEPGHLEKERFLRAFAETGIVVQACKKSRVSRSNVYWWQEHDEDFGLAFVQAKAISTEVMEAEAIRRAVEGTQKPVYQNGKLVGRVREFSDTLLIFMLKSRQPETYRERFDVQHSGHVGFTPLASLIADRDEASTGR